MNIHWLLRAKRLVQNPPSMGKVKFVFTIIALCIVLAIIERVFGWPEWLTPHGNGGRRIQF